MKRQIKLVVIEDSTTDMISMSKYDENGNVLYSIGMDGIPILFKYDETGNLVSETKMGLLSTIFIYDKNNNLINTESTKLNDNIELDWIKSESFNYDENNNITERVFVQDDELHLFIMKYNDKNLEISRRNHIYSLVGESPVEIVHKYNYDENGNRIKIETFNDHMVYTNILIYNTNNKIVVDLIYIVDEAGNILNNRHDKSACHISDIQNYIDYYGENGTLDIDECKVTDGLWVSKYEYNNENLLSSITTPHERIEYYYDSIGKVLQEKHCIINRDMVNNTNLIVYPKPTNTDEYISDIHFEYNEYGDIINKEILYSDKNGTINTSANIKYSYIYY